MKSLTVIVPAYNMERYLSRCLSSLVVSPERLSRLEVLVINDGSRDSTSEIAHDFAARHPETFRVIDKPNGNYGSCVNRGLQEATGRFVKVLDADDAFDADEFAALMDRLEEQSEDIDVVLTDFFTVDTAGKRVERYRANFAEGELFSCADLVSRRECAPMHAVCYRLDLLKRIGYSQLEGISYTDTEWIYLPMAAIRRGVCHHAAPYLYTFGRDGQTMERSSVVKNLWMMEKIVTRQLDQYDHRPADVFNVEFLQQFLIRDLDYVVKVYAYEMPLANCTQLWMELDTWSAGRDFLAVALDGMAILSNSRLRFRYVRFGRRHPRLRTAALALVRAYHRLWLKIRYNTERAEDHQRVG